MHAGYRGRSTRKECTLLHSNHKHYVYMKHPTKSMCMEYTNTLLGATKDTILFYILRMAEYRKYYTIYLLTYYVACMQSIGSTILSYILLTTYGMWSIGSTILSTYLLRCVHAEYRKYYTIIVSGYISLASYTKMQDHEYHLHGIRWLYHPTGTRYLRLVGWMYQPTGTRYLRLLGWMYQPTGTR
jgi:hypothetical protein